MLNHTLYRLKYRYAKYLPLKVPVDVSLELSSKCNMFCSYCYHAEPKNLGFNRKFMPVEMAYKIITEAALSGVSSLKLNYRGEATLNPKFTPITSYARSFDFVELLLNSNFKIHPNRREDIFYGISKLDKVKISYDSFLSDVFEKQRSGGDHLLTSENIDLFYNYPNRKTEIVIQAVRTDLNKNEDLEYEIKKRWPHATASIRDLVGGRNNKTKDLKRDFNKRQSCIQAHARLIFTSEGNALPCCPDIKETLVLGNINEKSLKDIFNSYSAKILRENLKDGDAFKHPTCMNCPSHESFKGYKHPWKS